VSEAEMESRRGDESVRGAKAYTPSTRNRVISQALKAYASMVASADKGAVRQI
jgi:dihydroxy-acid dehydratase